MKDYVDSSPSWQTNNKPHLNSLPNKVVKLIREKPTFYLPGR